MQITWRLVCDRLRVGGWLQRAGWVHHHHLPPTTYDLPPTTTYHQPPTTYHHHHHLHPAPTPVGGLWLGFAGSGWGWLVAGGGWMVGGWMVVRGIWRKSVILSQTLPWRSEQRRQGSELHGKAMSTSALVLCEYCAPTASWYILHNRKIKQTSNASCT